MTDSVDSFAISEPPVLTLTNVRTVCSTCKATLFPNVYHVCPGNAHWHPDFTASPSPVVQSVMSEDQRKALMFALKACDDELFMSRNSTESARAAIHDVRRLIADAVINGGPV